MKKLLITMLFTLALASCQTTGPGPTKTYDYRPSAKNAAKVGRVYSGVIRIGEVSTPLPPGRWELISWRDVRSSLNTPIHYTVFAQHDSAQVTELLTIRASGAASASGWVISSICQRTGWHHIEVLSYAGGRGGEGLCWGVAHSVWSTTFKGVFEKNRQDLDRWTTSKGLADFNYGIARVYYAARLNFVLMKHIVNPVIQGYPDQPNLPWTDHPWSPRRIPADTPAHDFIQEQIRQAGAWWPSFQRANF